MNPARRHSLLLVAAAGLAAHFAYGQQPAPATSQPTGRAVTAGSSRGLGFAPRWGTLAATDTLPDLVLRRPDGAELPLTALRGTPVLLALAPADKVPVETLSSLAVRYRSYGVRVVAVLVDMKPSAFAAWARQLPAEGGFEVFADPAGAYAQAADAGDPAAAEAAWFATTIAGRFHAATRRPLLPVGLAIDGEGRMLGCFGFGDLVADATANLLLHAGVELEPVHRPQTIAPAAAFVARHLPKQPERLAVGAVAPDLMMQDLDGAPITLHQFRGKVVVLDFWATWCKPCLAAMPHAQDLAVAYRDQGLVVLAACTNDARDAFVQWVAEHRGEYPDLRFGHDAKERSPDRDALHLYGVNSIPTQFVIDRTGKVAAVVSGYVKGEVLLDAALAKAGIEVDPAILQQAILDQRRRDERSAGGRVELPAGGGR